MPGGRVLYELKVVQGSLHEGSDRFEAHLNAGVDDGYHLMQVVGVQGAVWAVMRRQKPGEETVVFVE